MKDQIKRTDSSILQQSLQNSSALLRIDPLCFAQHNGSLLQSAESKIGHCYFNSGGGDAGCGVQVPVPVPVRDHLCMPEGQGSANVEDRAHRGRTKAESGSSPWN